MGGLCCLQEPGGNRLEVESKVLLSLNKKDANFELRLSRDGKGVETKGMAYSLPGISTASQFIDCKGIQRMGDTCMSLLTHICEPPVPNDQTRKSHWLLHSSLHPPPPPKKIYSTRWVTCRPLATFTSLLL